jgi:very-short-patch-repair endonuclease
MDPVLAIDELGHIATRQQLIALGCSGYDLTRAVRCGRIRRVRQARYATAQAAPDAVAATRVGGLLAGPSAARTYGLWTGFDTRLHISVGENSSRLRTNVAPRFLTGSQSLTPDTSSERTVLHWLLGGAVPELGPECWRVSLPVCLRQMVAWSDKETAIACLDTALSVRKLTRGQLLSYFDEAAAADRSLAVACRGGSDSGPESLVRQRLRSLGIDLEQQVLIPGVGRIDGRIRGTRILLEIDGRQYHDGEVRFEGDRWRDAELAARHYIVIRLSYQRIIRDWPWCVRTILAAMASI